MMIINLIIFIVMLLVLIKSAEYAIKYSSKIAKALGFTEFIVSFFIIAIVSILPEATIAIISAIKGSPQLGLGTLLGSNIVDLTLVFGIVALFSHDGIKVKSKIINNNFFYLALLLLPLLLGFDGKFSRIDGAILLISGVFFFYKTYRESKKFHKKFDQAKREPFRKSLILLIISLAILLISAFLIVKYAVNFAEDVKIPKVLIGISILALGTCLPELIFSIKAVRKNHDELALGNILGTVIADATIVLGLVILINPFTYNPSTIYVAGGAMFLAGIFVLTFMKSDQSINKKEGVILIMFYILFIFLEFIVNHIINFK